MFYETAHGFDRWSETLLNNYMCSEDACPCLEYYSGNVSSREVFMSYPEKLRQHNRTFGHEKTLDGGQKLKYMHFTKAKNKVAFKSMGECLHHHDFATEDLVFRDPMDPEHANVTDLVTSMPQYLE